MGNPPYGTYHPRDAWISARYPVYGPSFDPGQVDTLSVHYTAADDLIDGDPGENWHDLPAYLRAIHRSYLNRQPSGYSIGYSFAVDQRGDVWELRGFEFRAAANRGWNHRTVAVLCLVDGADPLTPAALAAVRWLLARSVERVGRHLKVRPHSEIGATACPGDGIRAQIAEITPWVQAPAPEPVPEEDHMSRLALRWRPAGYKDQFLVANGAIERVTSGMVKRWKALGVLPPVVDEDDRNKLVDCLAATGITHEDLTPRD